MSAPSPEARRISTPGWLDLRLVLGVVLVLASVVIGATVVSRASDTHPSVTARHDLAAGTTLQADDLQITQVQLPDAGRARYLSRLKDGVGKTLTRPVSRDELVPTAAVGNTPARTTLTVPLATGAAPQLRAGQRIQVWVSTPSCAFVVLLADVTVQSVRSGEGGSFGSSGEGQDVVISVASAQASRVVAAQSIEDAQLGAGVLSGGSGTAASAVPSSPPSSPSSSLPSSASPSGSSRGPGGLPDDLAACAGSR